MAKKKAKLAINLEILCDGKENSCERTPEKLSFDFNPKFF